MGSIPTRSRHAHVASVLALLLCAVASRATAQQPDSARVGATRSVAAATDTLLIDRVPKPPVSARRAFLYSFAMPGLGQAALRRPAAGAFFFAIEVTALAMLGKSLADLREAKQFFGDSAAPILRFTPDSVGRVRRDARTGAMQFDTTSNRYRGVPSYISSRRTHVEDWAAAILFNHLISGADAFVAANLWDLPTQIEVRALPRGALIYVRLRR